MFSGPAGLFSSKKTPAVLLTGNVACSQKSHVRQSLEVAASGPALWRSRAGQVAGILPDRNSHSGTGHRGQYGNLLSRKRRFAQSPALSRAQPARIHVPGDAKLQE